MDQNGCNMVPRWVKNWPQDRPQQCAIAGNLQKRLRMPKMLRTSVFTVVFEKKAMWAQSLFFQKHRHERCFSRFYAEDEKTWCDTKTVYKWDYKKADLPLV